MDIYIWIIDICLFKIYIISPYTFKLNTVIPCLYNILHKV